MMTLRATFCFALVFAGCDGSRSGSDLRGDASAENTADTDADALADLDGGPEIEAGAELPPPSPWPLAASATCAPAAARCAPTSADPGLYASFRKDSRLDNTEYPEEITPVFTGGRVQVATVAATSGEVTGIIIDGVDADSIYAPVDGVTPAFEWYHVWPRQAVAGEPIYVAFHALNPHWDTLSEASLRVETREGVAVDGSFPVAITPAPLTWVTPTADYGAMLIHLRNGDAAPHTITRVLVGGRDVTGTGIACLATPTVAPGATALIEVPLCEATAPGRAWTVVIEYADAPAAVGVGRVIPPRFPINAWQNTSECAFPGGDPERYAILAAAGVDGAYFHGGMCAASNCDCDAAKVIGETIPAQPGRYTWAAADLAKLDFASTAGIAAFATGDESEFHIYADSGVPVGAAKAAESLAAWRRYPEVPTFNGGFTHNHIGVVAGMADIQGLDFYNAGCAPHITTLGNHPPPRGPYDYLRNTRDNHMPGPTWLYAQGLHSGWSWQDTSKQPVHSQPDRQEILLQAFSVLAAGGKGLLWFQTHQGEGAAAPERWEALADASWMIRGVARWAQAGDIGGAVEAPDDMIAALIRAPDALVLVAATLRPDPEVIQPSDLRCIEAKITPDEVPPPHHVFAARTATLSFEVPPDLGLVDAFEVRPHGPADMPVFPTASGRRVSLPDLPFSNDEAARIFVFARDASARATVTAAMDRPNNPPVPTVEPATP